MSKHLPFLIIAIVCSFHISAKAQFNPTPMQQAEVELIEDKQEKRWMLYAQNNSNEDKEAFLLVQGSGFRRSASRPTIKNVPAGQKVLMLTLIPLKGVKQEYKTIFTWESYLQSYSQRKGENDEAYVNIRPLEFNELTIFIEKDCAKCNALISYLNENQIKYRLLDVGVNHKVKEFMFDQLASSYEGGVVGLPTIIYQGRKHWSINNIDSFMKEYNWESAKKGG